MKIIVESKYNIGDEVFILVEEDRYNDYYSNEQIWRLKGNSDDYDETKLVISEVVVKEHRSSSTIMYSTGYAYYSENDIFTDLKDAEEEKDRRNEKDGYI